MAKTTAKASKKGRKHSRNHAACDAYRLEGRREKNKIKKIKRHLKNNSNDIQTQKALEKLS